MSWTTPSQNVVPQPQTLPPSMIAGNGLNQVQGLAIKEVVCTLVGGNRFGPSETFDIALRPSPLGFIKPNSLRLRVRVDVDVPNCLAWAFGGQSFGSGFGTGSNTTHTNPGSMILERIDVICPGGATMAYQRYDMYEWTIVLNHCLSREYVRYDLKQLMHCHTNRDCSDGTTGSKTAYLIIPMDLPIFNAASAYPLCLLNESTILRFYLNTVNNAFTSSGVNVDNYAVSEISLLYEEIQVSPQFKASLQSRGSPYMIGVKDRLFLGSTLANTSTRINSGVNLSSLKGVVGTNVLVRPGTTSILQYPAANGMTSFNVYINNIRMNPQEIDDEVICYYELSRALQIVNESNRSSNLNDITTTGASKTLRTNYIMGGFAFGYSTAVLDDEAYTFTGIPCNQLSVEVLRQAIDTTKWTTQNTISIGTFLQHLWALHDTVCIIGVDGSVQLRK